jgi:hypothetical protein
MSLKNNYVNAMTIFKIVLNLSTRLFFFFFLNISSDRYIIICVVGSFVSSVMCFKRFHLISHFHLTPVFGLSDFVVEVKKKVLITNMDAEVDEI